LLVLLSAHVRDEVQRAAQPMNESPAESCSEEKVDSKSGSRGVAGTAGVSHNSSMLWKH